MPLSLIHIWLSPDPPTECAYSQLASFPYPENQPAYGHSALGLKSAKKKQPRISCPYGTKEERFFQFPFLYLQFGTEQMQRVVSRMFQHIAYRQDCLLYTSTLSVCFFDIICQPPSPKKVNRVREVWYKATTAMLLSPNYNAIELLT